MQAIENDRYDGETQLFLVCWAFSYGSTAEWVRQEDLEGAAELLNDYLEQLRREGAKKRATTKQNKAKRQLMVEVRMQEQHRETDTKIPCPVCNKSCKGEKGLAMHQRRAHQ